MEASALRYSGPLGLPGRAPLLRLQSDERLIAFTRRGNQAAFEVLVSRYQARLLAFCRHLLGSREDAEDVLQEVLAAAFNALLADERPINVRPWLYRIARNRSLNHLRRVQAIGVDSMDIHFSEHGTSTADKVQQREQFRLLIGDIQGLPETQRTALILREMEALTYEQIAEAMENTVPGVRSLLVRARIALAEAAEARQLTCADVRLELGEVAEGLRKRPDALVRRHLKTCQRCNSFRGQLKSTSKALGILLPVGPLALLRRLVAGHIGHSASSGASGAASGGVASGGAGGVSSAGSAGALISGLAGSAGSVGVFSAGAGALATKTAAGLAAAMLVTAGAVEVSHVVHRAPAAPTAHRHHLVAATLGAVVRVPASAAAADVQPAAKAAHKHHVKVAVSKPTAQGVAKLGKTKTPTKTGGQHQLGTATTLHRHHKTTPPGRPQSQTSTTVLAPTGSGSTTGTTTTSTTTTTTTTGTGSKSSGSGAHHSGHRHRPTHRASSTTTTAK